MLLRTAGMSFQVYLSNRIGPEGIGLFQLIMSVYMLAITFSASGIRFAATRLVAEEMGAENFAGAIKAVKNCLLYAVVFSTAGMAAVSFGAEYIGLHWLGDERTVLSVRLLAYSLPFIALSSVLSGYFIAVRKVVRTAVIQVTEQTVKIVITLLLLSLALPKGLEYDCAAIVAGSCIGEIISFLLLFLLYRLEKKREDKGGDAGPRLVERMLHIALPVALSAYIVSSMNMVLQLLIPGQLKKSGSSGTAALSVYGLIQGMAMPVILFPSVILGSVSDLIVPELAQCRAGGRPKGLNYIISRVFKLGVLFCLCVMWIFLRYSGELGMAVYHSREAADYIKNARAAYSVYVSG